MPSADPARTLGIDRSRERCREAMAPTGRRPVAHVALDGTLAALRLRPATDVGGR